MSFDTQQYSAKRLSGVATLVLCAYALLTFPASSRATSNPGGDAVKGKTLFEKRCTGCHALDLNKEGPRLRSVYGRAAGKAEGFQYSDALESARVIWDDAMLERWLTDTQAVVPGNDMDFRVPKPEERADIIGYLRSLTAQ